MQETVIVVDSAGNPINRTPQTRVATAPVAVQHELTVVEFKHGVDSPKKFYLTVPRDLEYEQAISVDLGGTIYSVVIPSYVCRGEKVVVIAPAPTLSGTAVPE